MIIIDVEYEDTSNTAEVIDTYTLRRMIALLIEDLRPSMNGIAIEADVNDAMDRLRHWSRGKVAGCMVTLKYT